MTFFMILDEKPSKPTPLVEDKVLVVVIISVTVHGSRNKELGLRLGILSIIEALLVSNLLSQIWPNVNKKIVKFCCGF